MNRNMNYKINQVSENTLVVGIDIAKNKHYACAIDDRGRVLQKSFAFMNARHDFDYLHSTIVSLQEKHDKSELIIGFEPTGHYWMNLASYLVNLGIRFVMVNPLHVNRTKELDDNLQTKNDKKDARVIAQLVRDGRFSYPRILEGIEAELRNGASLRSKIQEDLSALRNRIIRWIDRFFPEFHLVFKKLGKTACAVLEKSPLPSDVKGKEIHELVELYRTVDYLKCVPKGKVNELLIVSEESIGLTEGLQMARYEIATLMSQFNLLSQQFDELSERLRELAAQLAEYEYILSVPGIGENTVVELLSEMGSPTHYEHPRQIIKLAGLTLRENSSGQHKGQKKISKRGRKKLRAILFRVILPLIQHNSAFKSMYKYYTTRRINPLRKKEAMVVLCCKLLKIVHALSKKKIYFSHTSMMNDLSCLEGAA
ncbi:IS110 family RNA-guided transposase [Litchfieldia alkalitelluris]|uniref:IS110 family transposase n=1 Tax=Litchfieldia alkalitelluris TaxID=304268 RepID=UPI000998B668|nr:IS110 family transposase [Litchfieldia alkalitelluris]